MDKKKLQDILKLAENTFFETPVFLSKVNPLKEIAAPFNVYSDLLNSLYKYNNLSSGGVRKVIKKVLLEKEFNFDNIKILTKLEKEKLYSVLAILCHCYRWDYLPPSKDQYKITKLDFPKKLWTPFCLLSDEFEIPYCGTLFTTTVSDFKITNKACGESYDFKEIEFDDIEVNHIWIEERYAKELEQWIKVFVMTEMKGGYSNLACLDILKAIVLDDLNRLKKGLENLHQGIKEITKVFNTQVRNVFLNIDLWRNYVQPSFIWGLESDPKFKYALEGASGLQVGCIHLLDLVLGIEMQSKMGEAMMNSRKYFPKEFRELLNSIEPYRYLLKEYLFKINNDELTNLYNRNISALKSYRKSHKNRGKVYIKGDGSEKQITTTGLSIKTSDIAIEDFEKDMSERIKETCAITR